MGKEDSRHLLRTDGVDVYTKVKTLQQTSEAWFLAEKAHEPRSNAGVAEC